MHYKKKSNFASKGKVSVFSFENDLYYQNFKLSLLDDLNDDNQIKRADRIERCFERYCCLGLAKKITSGNNTLLQTGFRLWNSRLSTANNYEAVRVALGIAANPTPSTYLGSERLEERIQASALVINTAPIQRDLSNGIEWEYIFELPGQGTTDLITEMEFVISDGGNEEALARITNNVSDPDQFNAWNLSTQPTVIRWAYQNLVT